MDERIAITFGGRQLGVSQVSGLPREASVALLIELAALQSAIAAQLWLSVSHVGTLEKSGGRDARKSGRERRGCAGVSRLDCCSE